jgi:hypothetical protein
MQKFSLLGVMLVCFVLFSGCENDVTLSASTPDQPATEAVYGMATKCLQGASFLSGSLQFQVTCSPIFQGVSYDDVSEQIQDWQDSNCPAQMSAELASGGFCTVNAYAGSESISNNLGDVQQDSIKYPDDCSAQPGILYGTPQC